MSPPTFYINNCPISPNNSNPLPKIPPSLYRLPFLDMGTRKRALTIKTDNKRGSEESAADEVNGGLRERVGGQPLSPAARLFHQPHLNCNIIIIFGSGKAADINAVKAGLEASLLRHPRFSSILVINQSINQLIKIRFITEVTIFFFFGDIFGLLDV